MQKEKIDTIELCRRMQKFMKVDIKTVQKWAEKEAIPIHDQHRSGLKKMFPEVYLPPIPLRKKLKRRMAPIMLPGTHATFDKKKQW